MSSNFVDSVKKSTSFSRRTLNYASPPVFLLLQRERERERLHSSDRQRPKNLAEFHALVIGEGDTRLCKASPEEVSDNEPSQM